MDGVAVQEAYISSRIQVSTEEASGVCPPREQEQPSSRDSRGEWKHSFNAKRCASVRVGAILLLSERLPVPTHN